MLCRIDSVATYVIVNHDSMRKQQTVDDENAVYTNITRMRYLIVLVRIHTAKSANAHSVTYIDSSTS